MDTGGNVARRGNPLPQGLVRPGALDRFAVSPDDLVARMDIWDERLGTVTLTPQRPIVAGEVGQWTLRYTVGSYGIDEGGTIKLARRFASDWQMPQFEHPTAPAYCTVSTTGEAKLRARYDAKGHARPWMKCVVIDVYDGSLAPGDVVEIVLGNREFGSLGIRSQSFIESAHELRVLVDPTNACLVRRLPSSPITRVVAAQAERVVVIVPTDAVVGESRRVFVKGEDRWGNPTAAPSDVRLQWEGTGAVTLAPDSLVFSSSGQGRVVAEWSGQTYASNPISTATDPAYRRYWADLHAQSDATVGTGSEIEYFAFGRDQAALDAMSHQGNDFQMTDADWQRLNEAVRTFHEDGRFVVFPGYEWSANTPAGGDRNVIYLEEGMPILRSSHWQIEGTPEDERTPAHPARELFAKLREHVDPSKVLLAAHCGGRYADIRHDFDEELGPLVEVTSCWGVFEWLLWDAFDRGYRVGIVCNSDGHKGRPGAEGPGAGQFGIYGGLTCILAPSLTRADVFAALRQRRCYGTTGARIDVAFTANKQPMGSCFRSNGSVRVLARARGTAPLEAIELYRGRERLSTYHPPEFDLLHDCRRVRLVWGGARIRGRGRRAVWDGTVEVSGNRIVDARPHAFDSPADGIREHTDTSIRFDSRTTGDIDGIDLWLESPAGGTVVLRTGLGELAADVASLDGQGVHATFGGLDLHATIRRYPEQPVTDELAIDVDVAVPEGRTTPVFIKVIQTDGHMAWTSPVYVD